MLPGTAHYYGQPVGALVVADSEAICDRALKLIEIEWEQLPVILDWDEAMHPDAPLLRPDLNEKNNLNSGSYELMNECSEELVDEPIIDGKLDVVP